MPGSSSVRNGGKSSEWTTLYGILTTKRSQRSLSTTHNITTKPTRYSSSRSNDSYSTSLTSSPGWTPGLHRTTWQNRLDRHVQNHNRGSYVAKPCVEYEKLADPRLPACSRKSGSLLETCCTIMDLKGVGVTKVSSVYAYVKQASTISQNYYPERLGKLYLINAPWGFSPVFNVVKGFLDAVTVSKIHVLGGNYQTELLAQVPAENLPNQFGGKCACEGGCALSDMGPWQDLQWTKPPKWERQGGSNTINNQPTNTIPSHAQPQAGPRTGNQVDEITAVPGSGHQVPMRH